MESGPERVRRRTTAPPIDLDVSWQFTDSQMAQFRAWFDADILNGLAWFDMLVFFGYSSDVSADSSLITSDASTITADSTNLPPGEATGMTRSCRFKGTYSAKLSRGMIWNVEAKLLVRSA